MRLDSLRADALAFGILREKLKHDSSDIFSFRAVLALTTFYRPLDANGIAWERRSATVTIAGFSRHETIVAAGRLKRKTKRRVCDIVLE